MDMACAVVVNVGDVGSWTVEDREGGLWALERCGFVGVQYAGNLGLRQLLSPLCHESPPGCYALLARPHVPSTVGDPMNMGSLRNELNLMSQHIGHLHGGFGSGSFLGSSFQGRPGSQTRTGSGMAAASGISGPGGSSDPRAGGLAHPGGVQVVPPSTDHASESEDDLDHDMMILGTTPSFLKPSLPQRASVMPPPPPRPRMVGAAAAAMAAAASSSSGGFVSAILGSGPLHQLSQPAQPVPEVLQQQAPQSSSGGSAAAVTAAGGAASAPAAPSGSPPALAPGAQGQPGALGGMVRQPALGSPSQDQQPLHSISSPLGGNSSSLAGAGAGRGMPLPRPSPLPQRTRDTAPGMAAIPVMGGEGDDEDDDDDDAAVDIGRLLHGGRSAAGGSDDEDEHARRSSSGLDGDSDDDMMGMSPDEPSMLLGAPHDRSQPMRSDVFNNPFKAHVRGRAAWPSAGGC